MPPRSLIPALVPTAFAAPASATAQVLGAPAMTGGAGSATDPDDDGANACRGLGSPAMRSREGDGRWAGTADLTTVAPETPATVDLSAPAPPVIAAAPVGASFAAPIITAATLRSHHTPLGRYPLANTGHRAESLDRGSPDHGT